MAAFAISSMALRPWAGWAADRYGRRPLMSRAGYAPTFLACAGLVVFAAGASAARARWARRS